MGERRTLSELIVRVGGEVVARLWAPGSSRGESDPQTGATGATDTAGGTGGTPAPGAANATAAAGAPGAADAALTRFDDSLPEVHLVPALADPSTLKGPGAFQLETRPADLTGSRMFAGLYPLRLAERGSLWIEHVKKLPGRRLPLEVRFGPSAGEVDARGDEAPAGKLGRSVRLDANHIVGPLRVRFVEVRPEHEARVHRPTGFAVEILVLPDKLGDGTEGGLDFAIELLEEVAALHPGLVIAKKSAGALALARGLQVVRSPAQTVLLMEELDRRTRLRLVIADVLRDPHRKVAVDHPLRSGGRLRRPDPTRLLRSLYRPGSTAPVLEGQTPHMASGEVRLRLFAAEERRVRVTYDTPPNRFLLRALRDFARVLRRAERQLEQDRQSRPLARRAGELARAFEQLRRRVPFDGVRPSDHLDLGNSVLQNEPRYRNVLSAWTHLFSRSDLHAHAERLLRYPLSEMPELYEYWCLLRLHSLLEARTVLGGTLRDGVTRRGVGGAMEIADNRVTIRYEGGIELRYELSFARPDSRPTAQARSYTLPMRPDFLVLRRNQAGRVVRLLVLDAKYRVKLSDLVAATRSEDEGARGRARAERRGEFQHGDVYKMHTYREALRLEGHRPDWAVVLYPGSEAQQWPDGCDSDSGRRGIAAFPLRPRREPEALQKLGELDGFLSEQLR